MGRREGEELLYGPEYVGSGSRDMEDIGYEGRGRTGRFKWPSISLAERQGYRYRRPPPEDDARIQAVPSSTTEMHAIGKLKRNLPSASTVGGIKSPTSIALKELYEAVLKSGLSSPASELVQECDEWRKDEEEERTPFLRQVSASGSGVQMTMSGKKRRGHVHHDSSSVDFLWLAAHHGNTAGGTCNSRTKLEVRNPIYLFIFWRYFATWEAVPRIR